MDRDFSRNISESVKLDDGPPARYQLRTKMIHLDRLSDKHSRLRRFTVGNKDPRHQNKTVLLVGAPGSGKSTLINALVNFVMGVKFEDKVWFEMVPDEKNKSQLDSQTSAVSVYQVFGFEGKTVPYSLTIIDTPGYGDIRGIEHDDIVTKLLQDLFCVLDGVKTIDAVGLVLKATVNRLDERMTYIFNSVTSLFGRDMEQNIVALMTHSDGMKPRGALQALDEAKVKCARDKNNEPVYFLFNNRQKKKIENKRDKRAAQFAFETSQDGMNDLTEFLGKCRPQSLKLTVEVMKERFPLPPRIQNLKERVETMIMKQEVIQRNKEQVLKYEEEMRKNQNFTVGIEEHYREEEDIPDAGLWGLVFYSGATVCKRCEENCHNPGCTVAMYPSRCEVMTNRRCTSCTRKCPVENHVKENWIYVDKTRKVKKTYEEMKAKYEKNKAQSEEKTSLVEDLEKEMATLQKQNNLFLDEFFQHLERWKRFLK